MTTYKRNSNSWLKISIFLGVEAEYFPSWGTKHLARDKDTTDCLDWYDCIVLMVISMIPESRNLGKKGHNR